VIFSISAKVMVASQNKPSMHIMDAEYSVIQRAGLLVIDQFIDVVTAAV